jgi:DNA modification methylase
VWTVLHGDCLDVMRTMPDASVHAVVTDPPYGLGFMGKAWDDLPPGVEWAAECLRVLRPGGYLLAFGGTRTFHRLACAVEDAGFEIRDSIAWLYGQGFPKSLDVGKAIDKTRDDREEVHAVVDFLRTHLPERPDWPAIDAACGCPNTRQKFFTRSTAGMSSRCPTWPQWAALRNLLGFGAYMDAEVWRLNGRKGTPGEAWGQREKTGEQNVPVGHAFAGSTYGGDSSGRVVDVTAPATPAAREWAGWGTALKPAFEPVVVARKPMRGTVAGNVQKWGTGALNIDAAKTVDDRWPPNVTMDGSQASALGSEARFFPTFRYQAKAPTAERPTYTTPDGRKISHPTVKPLGLMRWLVRLVTPPGGTVLDPFAGSGATLEACLIEGLDCIAIERDPESLPLIQIRIDRQAGTLPFEDVS